jgi:nitroreductase
VEFIELIKKRFSCRVYENKPITEEHLCKILEAGRLAPSARNRQDWMFYYAELNGRSDNFVEASCGQKFLGKVPGFIAVCAKEDGFILKSGQNAATIDCSIATTFLMLQACELGIGTCWIGTFNAEQMKSLFDIPNEYILVSILAIGYPATIPNPTPPYPRTRKAISDIFNPCPSKLK